MKFMPGLVHLTRKHLVALLVPYEKQAHFDHPNILMIGQDSLAYYPGLASKADDDL